MYAKFYHVLEARGNRGGVAAEMEAGAVVELLLKLRTGAVTIDAIYSE